MRTFCVALLVAATLTIGAQRLQAKPKFSTAEEKPCAYCHVKPAGGGERNYRGAFYAAHDYSFADFDDAAEAKKSGVAVGPEADPPPKSRRAAEKPEKVENPPPPVPAPDTAAVPDFGEVELDGIVFIKIPAGSFRQGTAPAQQAAWEKSGLWRKTDTTEMPARNVTISRPFLISKYEITQKQWLAVMDNESLDNTKKPGGRRRDPNPSSFKGDDLPVDSVSYNDAKNFIAALGEDSGGKKLYRLPTEAEWEYVCRAGSDDAFGLGADKIPITPDDLGEYAWFQPNAENKTHPVGTKKPNAWGIYDLHGNVWEWCADDYAPDAYEKLPVTDPVCQEKNATEHVLRGGCWFLDARALRAGLRGGALPETKSAYIGLRVVREL